jgi:hypothetical protein
MVLRENVRTLRNTQIHSVGWMQSLSMLKHVLHVEPPSFKRFMPTLSLFNYLHVAKLGMPLCRFCRVKFVWTVIFYFEVILCFLRPHSCRPVCFIICILEYLYFRPPDDATTLFKIGKSISRQMIYVFLLNLSNFVLILIFRSKRTSEFLLRLRRWNFRSWISIFHWKWCSVRFVSICSSPCT